MDVAPTVFSGSLITVELRLAPKLRTLCDNDEDVADGSLPGLVCSGLLIESVGSPEVSVSTVEVAFGNCRRPNSHIVVSAQLAGVRCVIEHRGAEDQFGRGAG